MGGGEPLLELLLALLLQLLLGAGSGLPGGRSQGGDRPVSERVHVDAAGDPPGVGDRPRGRAGGDTGGCTTTWRCGSGASPPPTSTGSPSRSARRPSNGT